MKLQLKISMGEICLMIPKSGAKFEEKLIFYFKNDKNLVNFDLTTKSLKNLHFDWSSWTKCTTFHPKKYRGVVFYDTEESCKFEEKLTCALENDMKNLANFH